MRTLYLMFDRNQYGFSVKQLPMKGKRHPNGYVEHRGKAGQLGRSIYQRLLVVMNTQLAAVCAPFIACLPAISMAFPLNSYR